MAANADLAADVRVHIAGEKAKRPAAVALELAANEFVRALDTLDVYVVVSESDVKPPHAERVPLVG